MAGLRRSDGDRDRDAARHRSAPSDRSPRLGLLGRTGRPRSCSSKQAPGAQGRILAGDLPCLHPVASSGTIDVGPFTIHMYGLMLLLAIAACRRADRVSLGELGRRLGSRLPRRGVGRRRRDRRRAPLPRHHELERGARPLVGAVRRLAGRARRLGRDPLRRARRRVGRPPLGAERAALHGRRRARPPARAGDRPLGQLVQPGALRQADRPAVGPRDRPVAPAGGLLRPRDLPPDVPLRVRVRPDRRRRSCYSVDRRFKIRAAGPLRALRLLLLLRPLLRGAAPRRSRARVPRPAPERVGLDRRVLLSTGFFIWWQFIRPPSGEDRPRASRDRAPGPGDVRPQGPRPLRDARVPAR